ncbi:Short-chain dehydrogenase reductase 3a [Daldinia childiae]|uniref:Short-chain dehydrogenase reductase 3a n=1 Tax=Daldinia childiae TaxID=326645 RepID=UPI0014481FA1|nr:Short-chain dehydrogenase reductase 3a [Daldinia childiae]KAF3059217.1 Short-chain dehydrogenase reductase 3a [Daldinia childiae]
MNGNSTQTRPLSVIVTGGSSGLGATMTKYFASLGYAVSILDVNTALGHKVVTDIGSEYPQSSISFKRVDVTSWSDLDTAFREVYQQRGAVDIVMANAGISEQGASSLTLVDEEEPSQPRLRTLDVNLTGVIYTVKLAAHYIRKNKPDPTTGSRGTIICTSSNAGLYPFPVAPMYAASKAGVIGLVRSLARVLERVNIRINALAPAVLESGLAPSKALFEEMIVTPQETLIKGIAQLIEEPKINGAVAEIHGNSVTLRPPHEYVDEATHSNLETFWKLGVA